MGERREIRAGRSLLDHWQLWLLLLSFAIACVRFYYTVGDLDTNQKKWQEGSEARREHTRDIQEKDHIQAAVQANDIEWLKKLRSEGRTHG